MITGEGWSRLFDELKAKDELGSDAELARSLGITRAYICSVRKGRKNVSMKLGQDIFTRLGKTITENDLGILSPMRVQRQAAVEIIVRKYVLNRAKGKCQLCDQPAPFLDQSGKPYLELHHVVPFVLGGNGSKDNLVALCPNCHKKMDICPTEADLNKLLDVVSRDRLRPQGKRTR